MTAGGVNRTVLTPHYKVVDVAQREGHGGDSDCLALFKHQLQTVLQGNHMQQSTDQHHNLGYNDSVFVHDPYGCNVPAAVTACPDSRSTSYHLWKC